MTLNELKGKYARLSNEIDSLAGAGERNAARLMRLMDDLDQVHLELADLRRRTLAAPILRDEVATVASHAPQLVPVPMRPAQHEAPTVQVAGLRQAVFQPALSMAG